MRQGFMGATVTVRGWRQRQDHGMRHDHEWNRAMAMNRIGP